MPLDTFSFEFAFFLSLATILASLPTDPYFHPWHEGPASYRISHDPYRPPPLGRNDPRIDGQVFSAFGRGGFDSPGFPPSYDVPPQDRWYQLEQRSRGPHDDRRDFPSYREEFQDRKSPPSHGRSSGFVSGDEYPVGSEGSVGAQNIGNSYSSHVNCETINQKKEAVPKNIRENIEPIFGAGIPGKEDGINFDETRKVRTGNAKDVDVPNPRIVTPKSRRRPPQGNPAKNQNKPFNSGATNIISTTEMFRNQTAKGSKKPRPNASKPQGGDIVFPDGYLKKFIPRVNKCAKTSTFCEHVGEEYPSDYISQVLKKEGAMFREFFGRDVISDPNITERINAPEENSLCPYRQEVVFPRAAQNKEDKWLFIINQEQYVQGVTVEVCLNPENRCILTEGFPLGYTPYCKQKYIERRLVAIGEDGKPHSDSFRLPSCCSCVVKHETSARMSFARTSREALEPPRT